MTERGVKFNSWVVSIISILYGLLSIYIRFSSHGVAIMNDSVYGYTYYLLYLLLIICGIMKIVGIIFNKKLVKRYFIVALMFGWGFIWTTAIIEFFVTGPNRHVVTILPMIAISAYIAVRGDYR